MTDVELTVDKIIIELRSRFPIADIEDDRSNRTVRALDPKTGDELARQTY